MKNTLKLFSVIAIACSLLACAKEGQPETNNPAEPKDKKVTISFVADDAISVKTVLNNDNTASWAESGEYLRVFETAGQTVTSVKSNDSYTLENGKATFSATFDTNEDASSFVYNAVYPESSWVTENNNDLSALRLTTPAVQRPTLASYDPDADRLISKATEAVTEQGGADFAPEIRTPCIALQDDHYRTGHNRPCDKCQLHLCRQESGGNKHSKPRKRCYGV